MQGLFDALPLPLLALIFAVAAASVWTAGSRLPFFVSEIAERSGVGQAFAGFVLLGGITSLPELATTTSAAAIGAPLLALNNILGSIAFNLVLLAIADALLGKAALTSVLVRPATLMQGILAMLLLAMLAAAIASGERSFLAVGVGSTMLFGFCLTAIWIAYRYERRPAWVVIGEIGEAVRDRATTDLSLPRIVSNILVLAAVILAAGFLLSLSGQAIAHRTGMATSLVGLLFVAIATSLPELSAVRAAMLMRRYELAVGDVFGANLFNLTAIFLIDLVFPGAPVLTVAGPFEVIAAMLGLMLTGIFVVGLLERRDRTIFRMGRDSFGVLILYAAGIMFLSGVPGS